MSTYELSVHEYNILFQQYTTHNIGRGGGGGGGGGGDGSPVYNFTNHYLLSQ
jgi:hypothetical protein